MLHLEGGGAFLVKGGEAFVQALMSRIRAARLPAMIGRSAEEIRAFVRSIAVHSHPRWHRFALLVHHLRSISIGMQNH